MSGCDRRYEQDEVINLLYQNLKDFDCCANGAAKKRACGVSDDNHCLWKSGEMVAAIVC